MIQPASGPLTVPLKYVLGDVGDGNSHTHSSPYKVLAFDVKSTVLAAGAAHYVLF
jgi:hypothetical protein